MRDILERAYHLIDDKRRWTQFQYARDSLEGRVDSKDPAAVCWCAAGAIIAQPGYSRALLGVVNGISIKMYDKHLSEVNDQLGYRQARAVMRRAIREAVE